MTTLHNSMPKEQFKETLRQKTNSIDFIDNRSYRNYYLSKIEEDQIYVYYAGEGSSERWFVADLEDGASGTVIKGEFVLIDSARKFSYLTLISVWVIFICLPKFTRYHVDFVWAIIATFLLYIRMFFMKTGAEKKDEQAIYAFLENLC